MHPCVALPWNTKTGSRAPTRALFAHLFGMSGIYRG
jgi:hypothetical protein